MGFYDDIWALGVVLFAFIFGTVPFFHPLDYQLFESIEKDSLKLPDNDTLSASEEIRDLIQRLLVKKDEERIKIEDVIKHEWYTKNNYVHPEYIIEDDDDDDVVEGRDDCFCVML